MSLFAKHISASRGNGRVAVNLRNEDIDPLNGVVADEPIDTEVDEGPEEGAESDKFAAQRNLLNRRHGMIRNRRFRNEDDAEIVIDEAPADEEVGEDEVVVDAPEGEDEVVEITEEGDEIVDDVEGDPVVDADGDVEFTSEDDEVSEEEDVSGDEVVDEIDEEVDEIEDLENEMRMLQDSMMAIESFGINPTALAVMQTTGLLDSTALESLGLEAFGFEAPSDAHSQMALEALGDKIKEKAAEWSAKIVSLAKTAGSKLLSITTTIYQKIAGVTKSLTSFTWDKTKALGANVKAHPYKYLIGIVAAIAAVAGLVAFSGANFPAGGKLETVQKFLNTFVAKVKAIKVPSLNIKANVVAGTNKVKVVVTGAYETAKTATVAKYGWTKSAVSSLGGQLSRAFGATKDGIKAFGTRAVKLATSFGTSAGQTASSFANSFVSVIRSIGSLIAKVVIGGFRQIGSTLKALVSAVKPAGAAAAAA